MINFRVVQVYGSLILRKPELLPGELKRNLRLTSPIVEREYRKEVPVDSGFGRASIHSDDSGSYGYIVRPHLSDKKGYNYLLVVHEGSGIYKGVPVDYGHPGNGRTRFKRSGGAFTKTNSRSGKTRNMTRQEMQKMFAGMAKRGVKFNIKPDKFADRAKNTAMPKVYADFKRNLLNTIL